jgi:hypothetical protein
MAEILDLKEDFSGVAIGATPTSGTTIFDAFSGTATNLVIVDPYDATKRMVELTASSTSRSHNANLPATTDLWVRFDFEIKTAFNPIVGVFNIHDTSAIANKVLDIRAIAGARQLQLRNVNTVAYTTPVFDPDTKYRAYVHATAGGSQIIRLIIFTGPNLNTPFSDSGDIAATHTAPTIGHVRIGTFTNSTGVFRFGDIRGDNSTMPVDAPAGTVEVSASDETPDTGDVVTLTATKTGTGTLAISQTSGPTVTLTPSGDTWTFEMPGTITAGVPVSTSVTFDVTYGGATDTVTVTAGPHHRWRRMADNSRKPVIRRRYSP